METPQEIDFLSLLLPLVVVVFIIAIGVFLLNQQFQKNLFKQRLQSEELRSAHQKELLKSSVHVQEVERKRIAKDIHDELGASLSIVRMQLVRLEEMSDIESGFSNSLHSIRTIMESAIASVREISHQLMPPQLGSLGLVKTLESLKNRIEDGGNLTFELKGTNDIERMPWEIEVGLYRICMELIQNTIKHANASKAEVHLAYAEEWIILTYKDDGQGISEIKNSGLGLKNMEARAASLGGSFEIVPGKGFEASVQIPINESSDE